MLKSRLMEGIMEHKRDVSTIRHQELAWHTKLINILTATWHDLLCRSLCSMGSILTSWLNLSHSPYECLAV